MAKHRLMLPDKIYAYFAGCGEPDQAENAFITSVTSFTAGSIATYQCNVGFTLTRNPSRTCLPNGQWTTAPICTHIHKPGTHKLKSWLSTLRQYTRLCEVYGFHNISSSEINKQAVINYFLTKEK